MKTQYRFLFFVCLLAGRMAVGQELGPGGSAGVDAPASNNALRIGAGVAIPLYKLFGPKKAKTLPVWDKYRTLELPDSLMGKGLVTDVPPGTDSATKPIQAVMSGGVAGTGGTGVGEGSRTNGDPGDGDETAWTNDLPPVIITAPKIEIRPPVVVGGGGGYGGPDIPPASVDPMPVDPPYEDPDQPKPKTCAQLRQTAYDSYVATNRVAGLAFAAALYGCGKLTLSASLATAVSNAWVVVIPGAGEAVMVLLETGTILTVGGGCVFIAESGFRAAMLASQATYDAALYTYKDCK